jgi:hypothetical protein
MEKKMNLSTAKERIAYYKIPEKLAKFMLKREQSKSGNIKHTSYCNHPKNTGIGKKDTVFLGECCNVRFDRKTFPKSGKSVLNGCFIEKKPYGWLVWEKTTRALLGLVYNESNLESKTKEWKRRFNEQYGDFISG